MFPSSNMKYTPNLKTDGLKEQKVTFKVYEESGNPVLLNWGHGGLPGDTWQPLQTTVLLQLGEGADITSTL